MMKPEKRHRLAKAGWRIGTAREFAGLSDAEAVIVEVKVALARQLKSQRIERKYSQAQIAKLVGSSQSRVARMEAGDPSVSVDLLVRALATCGLSVAEMGRALARTATKR